MMLGNILSIETRKIHSDQFLPSSYISTDNMLPDAGGILFDHSKVPAGRSTEYKKGDVLFSNIRTYFRKIWHADRDGACSSDVLVLRANQEYLDSRFLYYTLLRRDFTEYSARTSKGAKMPRGDKAALRQFSVQLPSLTKQRTIAALLGALDDKIELNREMNATLEEMARALFRDWFVDFGPIRAKQAGQPPYLAPDLWPLFPNRLDGEGKPEGWIEKPLTAFFSIIGGGTPKTSSPEFWDGPILWFSVKDTPPTGSAFVIQTEKTITEAGLSGSSARLIPAGTTIISARGTVGNLAIAGQDMTFNQSCYGLRAIDPVGNFYRLFDCAEYGKPTPINGA